MMRRASSLLLVAMACLVLTPSSVQAAKRRGLFERLATAFSGSAADGMAAKAESAADALGDVLDDNMAQDMWAEDREMIVLQKMMNGDSFAIFEDFMNVEGIEEVWSSPKVVYRMLQAYPILESVKGVKEIMAKKQEEITSADGMGILTNLQTLVSAYTNKMAEMATSDGLKDIFTSYRNDPKLKDLFDTVDAGGDGAHAASLELQQKIADDVWGGLIDLKAFGLDGKTEPRGITQARDWVMGAEPKTWNLITQNDPTIKAILENPLKAAEILTQGLDPTGEFQLPKFM